MVPISETVVRRDGIITCALDHAGYPTLVKPCEIIGLHAHELEHCVLNVRELYEMVKGVIDNRRDGHMPVYYAGGPQRVAHISPLPRDRAVVQVWAIEETKREECLRRRHKK